LIAIEADGWDEHGRKRGFQTDRHRDGPLQTMGWIVLRFTWEDVTTRSGYVLDSVAEALRARGLLI
jgi:very-short-patch-repair endonuclease